MTLFVHEWEMTPLFWQVALLCCHLSDPCSHLATAPGRAGTAVIEQGGHVGALHNDRNVQNFKSNCGHKSRNTSMYKSLEIEGKISVSSFIVHSSLIS